jgi:hypothetical protein
LPVCGRQQPSFLVAEALKIVRFHRILVIFGYTEFALQLFGQPHSNITDFAEIGARVQLASLYKTGRLFVAEYD